MIFFCMLQTKDIASRLCPFSQKEKKEVQIRTLVETIILLILLLMPAIVAYGAPPYANNVHVFQNFDGLTATPTDSTPVSADGWIYNADLGYGRAGWSKGNLQFFIYDASARRVWSNFHYIQINNQIAINGGNSLEQVITGGMRDKTTNDHCGSQLANKEQYLTYIANGVTPECQDNTYMLGEGYTYFKDVTNKPLAAAQGANRLSIYIKTPDYFSIGGINDTYPQRNLNIGPYSTVGGGHFYHYYYLEGKEGWVHLLVDTHPTHNNTFGMEGHPGYNESYFNGMFKFYVRAWNEADNALGWQGSGIAPYSIYYDEIEFYNDPEPQNDQTINSPGVAFDPETGTFNICFNDKYWDFDAPATYQIKYSFSPITNTNYASAKNIHISADSRFGGINQNTTGVITKTNTYRGMLWAPFTLEIEDTGKVKAGQRIYFAIKDISSRDYSDTRYDAINDLATTTVTGLGAIKEIDLIKRIDYQASLHLEDVKPQIKAIVIE